MSCRLALCCVGAFVACSRPATSSKDTPPPATSVVIAPASATTTTSEPPASSEGKAASAPDDCEHLFSPPEGAEKLCDEHNLATDAEVHWQSWATTESRVDVNRRYHELAARCHVGFVTKPPIFSVSKGPTRLSTHEASPVSYPTCSKLPSASHKTVIMISTMLKR